MTTTFRNTTIGKEINKGPNDVLDYYFDWTSWLDSTSPAETISSHEITVPAGLTLDSSEETGGVVKVWLSGGTVGKKYPVTCKIVTSAGRTRQQTFYVDLIKR